MKKIQSGVACMFKGKYWGTLYEDGRSCSMGYTDDPTKIKISDPRFCSKPRHMPWQGSLEVRSLMKGKLIPVRKVTYIEEV